MKPVNRNHTLDVEFMIAIECTGVCLRKVVTDYRWSAPDKWSLHQVLLYTI